MKSKGLSKCLTHQKTGQAESVDDLTYTNASASKKFYGDMNTHRGNTCP